MKQTILRWLLRVLSVAVCAVIIYMILIGAGYAALPSATPDAVSKATGAAVTADDMDGSYVVLFNRSLHESTAADWEAFFSFDEDVPLIMEDITCAVAQGDAQGQEIAENYRQRLPENQMTVTQESGTLLISKAEVCRFDVIILSGTQAQALTASTLYDRDDILAMRFGGAQ